jgi:hypothetical protein
VVLRRCSTSTQAVQSLVQLRRANLTQPAPRSHYRCLVQQIGQGGGRPACAAIGQGDQPDISGEGLICRMQLQDVQPLKLIRQLQGDAAVEAAGAAEGVVEGCGGIGGS